jgi:tetratricopeptide (TPR) repeat protein
MMKILLIFVGILFGVNLQAEQLRLKTDPPDATIYIRDLNGTTNNKIHNTPYEGSINDLATNYAKSNFFLLVIEKNGYQTQSVLMSDLLKSDIELTITLVPNEDILHYRKIDQLITNLFKAQSKIRSEQYDEAISSLKLMKGDFPLLSVIPEILGSTYYVKKDPKAALSSFSDAYRLNPENSEAYNKMKYLQTALGGQNARP